MQSDSKQGNAVNRRSALSRTVDAIVKARIEDIAASREITQIGHIRSSLRELVHALTSKIGVAKLGQNIVQLHPEGSANEANGLIKITLGDYSFIFHDLSKKFDPNTEVLIEHKGEFSTVINQNLPDVMWRFFMRREEGGAA